MFAIVDVRSIASPTLERRSELETSAGPHPPRQRHRRQEAAALRMTVGPELVGRCERQEVEPMPQRRNRAPVDGRRVIAVERGREGGQRDRRNAIRATFGPADPLREIRRLDGGGNGCAQGLKPVSL